MTKPGKRSFFGLFSSASAILMLFAMLCAPSPAQAQFVASGVCDDIQLHELYAAAVDEICKQPAIEPVCDGCTCVQLQKAKFEKIRIQKQEFYSNDPDEFKNIYERVDQINEAFGATLWCKVNFTQNPVWTAVFDTLKAISAVSSWGGLVSAAIIALADIIVNQVINIIATLVCSALVEVLNFIANLICLPFLNLDILIPKFIFNFGLGSKCNGYPLGVFTGVPPPPPPLLYSSIPRITYRSKVHVITP